MAHSSEKDDLSSGRESRDSILPGDSSGRESRDSILPGDSSGRESLLPEPRTSGYPSIPPPPPKRVEPADRGKDYETLAGGSGREVFFRPTRYRRDDFGGVLPVVEVTFGDAVYSCDLQDTSQNGLAFVWPFEPPLPAGTELPQIVIRLDGHEAYRGSAVVTVVREVDGRRVVAAAFADSLMNIDDVLHLRDVVSWKPMTDGGLTAAGMSWHTPGFETFKSLCSEMRLFFEDSAARFAEFEARLPWHIVHGDAENPARDAMLRQLQKDFVPEYLRFAYGLDAASRGASREAWNALKDYSLRLVGPHLMQAPFVQRARAKPLGYPGDYEVMRYLYGRRLEGQTLFAKALHFAVVHMAAGEAVRQRKELLRQAMAQRIAEAEPGQTVRIASVAAGPAREVYELLHGLTPSSVRVEIVLFDQDRLALSHAQSRIAPVAARRPNVRVRYLHDSIKRLLHDPTLFQSYGPFDVLFCAGLFDYLKTSTATNLTAILYRNLGAGGRAYVGNMVDNPCRWFLEMHCDWYLTYRTREEIADFGRAAVAGAPLQVIDDPTGVNPFLVIQKA